MNQAAAMVREARISFKGGRHTLSVWRAGVITLPMSPLLLLAALLAPRVAIDLENPGPPVPRELFGTNLPARAEVTPRIPALLKSLGLTLYRYPGGSSPGWDWMTGRFMFPVIPGDNNCHLNTPDQLFAFVDAAGGEVLMQVNVESGTPAQAAGLATRSAGHGVRYWEIGNEVFGDWDNGYRSASQYITDVNAYSDAIKGVDANALIGADMAGEYRDIDDDGDAVDTNDWDRRVLQGTRGKIDFMSYHWYAGRRDQEDPLHVMAGSLRIPIDMARFRMMSVNDGGRQLPVGYLEWDGVFDNDSTGARHTLANAIFYADALGQMIYEGVALSTHYDATTRSYGLVHAYDPCESRPGFHAWDGMTIRPKGYALQLASRLAGGRLVVARVTDSGSYTVTTTSPMQEYAGEVPYMAAYASRPGGNIAILVVHRHPTAEAETTFSLATGSGPALPAQARALVSVLTGPSLTASNELSAPTVIVTPEMKTLTLPLFTLTMAPRSVTLIEIAVGGGAGDGGVEDGDGGAGGDGGGDGGSDGGGDGGGCGCRTGTGAGTGAGTMMLVVLLTLVIWCRTHRGNG